MTESSFPVSGAPEAEGRRARAWLFTACVLLPWLNPFAAGPSSSVDPWLFSAVCAAVACAFQPTARFNLVLLAGFAALCGWALAISGPIPETAALAGACVLALLAASASAAGAHRADQLRALALGWLIAAAISTAIAL